MGVEYKDYYKILGLEREANSDQISKTFKKLARKYHPDLNQGDKAAEDKFKEINEAHEVLKDPEKRRLYDQLGPNWQQGQQFGGGSGYSQAGFDFGGGMFSDFFESLFGQAQGGRTHQFGSSNFGNEGFGNFSRPQKGQDIEAEFNISLEDALKGGEKQFTIQGPEGPKTLKVNIPAGVKNGAKLRLSGQGGQSFNGQPGDLYLKISFAKHAYFNVEDDNIIYNLSLMPWQAALGDKVRVPTLDSEVELNIKANTQAGHRLRLRGKGLGTERKRGDQFVDIKIDIPSELTDAQRELWEALAQGYNSDLK